MAQVLHLNAIKMNQPLDGDKEMFMTTVPVKYLIDNTFFRINWWEREKEGTLGQGYQRKPESDTRKKRVAKYFNNALNPIFPTNIVLVSRKKLKFEKQDNRSGIGTIELNNYPLFILDGQNRIIGFDYSVNEEGMEEILNYEMPVTILSGFDLKGEVEQFYILNTEQKKVKTDLAQRLRRELIREMGEPKFTDLYGDAWEMRALPIFIKINEKKNMGLERDNVWYQNIYEPNENKKAVRKQISQNSFITSLRPLLKGGAFEGITADAAADALYEYWAAIKETFPECFAMPRDYVIQKTPGVFSLHLLANAIFKRIYTEKKDWTKENIKPYLKKAFEGDYDHNFWMSNNRQGATLYGSMKGFKMLSEHFIDNLDR